MSASDKYGGWSCSTSGCFVADKGTNFDVYDVNESVGINVKIDNEAIIHITISQAQADMLAEKLGEYLDKRQQNKLTAMAEITDAAFERVAV